MFVDLTGSTALVAARRPGEVVAVLNEFFRIVVDVVNRHGGVSGLRRAAKPPRWRRRGTHGRA
jgi:class 3 adenylate cyclase